jgi:methionine-rich copper-binding protein CopC
MRTQILGFSRLGAGIGAALILGASIAAAPVTLADVHFALARSVPAADATVTPPSELQLWFTEAPQPGSLSVRLTNAGGDLVETAAPVAAEDDAKEIHVAAGGPLGAGRYTVAWRGIGDDGHGVQGSFGFTVTAE